VASSNPSGANETALTWPACPRSVARSVPVAASQVRAVPSPDPVPIMVPDGAYASALTHDECPASATRGRPVAVSQVRAVPSSAVAGARSCVERAPRLTSEGNGQDVEAVDTAKVPAVGCPDAPPGSHGGRGDEPVVRPDVLAGGGESSPDAGMRASSEEVEGNRGEPAHLGHSASRRQAPDGAFKVDEDGGI
jgi:hypothetical protein